MARPRDRLTGRTKALEPRPAEAVPDLVPNLKGPGQKVPGLKAQARRDQGQKDQGRSRLVAGQMAQGLLRRPSISQLRSSSAGTRSSAMDPISRWI